jgi:tetratricopeptide (TPR) repeat protein
LLLTLCIAAVGFAGLSYRLGKVNHDLRESNAREADARKHLFAALEAVASGGAEDHLVGQRDLTPRQREFYETLVKQFRALADAAPGDDDTQRQVANAMTALGGLKNRMGDPDAAVAILHDAIRRQQTLRDRNPSDPDLTADLARSQWVLGHALEQKEEWAAADAAFGTTVELLDPIVQVDPDRLRDLRVLGSAKKCLAITHSAVRKRGSADWLERGLADLERLLAKTPDDPWARFEAADCLHLIAGARSGRGDYPAAKEACDRGLAYLEPLVRRPSAEIHYLSVEAKLLVNRAATMAALKDLPAAHGDYDSAAKKLSAILDRSPGQHSVRRQLGLAQMKRGQLFDESGDQPAALKQFDDATATFQRLADDQPRVPNHRHNLAWVCEERSRVLIKLGRHKEARTNLAECLRVWEPLAKEYEGKNYWYALGIADTIVSQLLLPPADCPYQTPDEREAAAVKAIANLNAAVASGWRPSARTLKEYKTSTKWEWFRTRADFREYMAAVEKLATK